MNLDTLKKLRKLFAVLVATVAVMLLIVILAGVHVLNQSRARYYANAEETSRNLAITLENFLHSHFQEADLAMRRAALEFRSMHQEGRFDDARFSAYLRTLKERLPQAQAVRGSDAAGRVIYGEQVDPAHPQDLSIREFFQRAKTERELIFGVPVVSRISGEWVLPLMTALTLPNGDFGGTAYVNMSNSRINELFSMLKTGKHGVITLVDQQKRILYRYPVAPELPIGTPIKVSPETQAALEGGHPRVTYKSVSVRDGMERVLSLEKIGDYPVYVLVGLSSDDFLAHWHKEIRNASIFLGLLLCLSVAMLVGVYYALNKQYESLQRLVETDAALQGSLGALTASESRWRSLTEGLPQMVWTATPAFRVDFMSHHWEAFSGLPSSQLLLEGDWSAIIHADDMPQVRAAWERARGGAEAFRCDCRLRRHDGAWRVFDHHALPQKSGDAVLSWVGSSTDITETRAVHDALLLAKEMAVQAGRAKSEFVANMSHEIRSPMNAVLGMLQLLQQTDMSERQQDYAAKAHLAASALLGLLNDILDFSKVEAGKLALDPHPFRLDKLWRDLSVILSANVGEKRIEVLFSIDPLLPQVVVGDALRLQQILLNLAGNAIKFTEHGEVVLSARLLAQVGNRLSIAFAIRDTGIGISDEQCAHIFEGFSQAEASTARRYGGTGLGLAISQRLVLLMGGALRVSSELGQGSVFDFVIECESAEPAGVAGTAPAPPAALALSSHALMRDLDCLVVDDNPTARLVLREMATAFGWRVDTGDSGAQALAMVGARVAQGRPYDVVFIDWRMPDLDGWETSCRIRTLLPSKKTPLIVMVTAHDRELLAQRHQAMTPVLDGLVVKPVTASMLFDAVADARLERRTALATAPQPSLRRLAGVRLLLVDDNPANQQVASELLGNDGAVVDVANSGPAAIAAVVGGGPLPDLILMDIQMPEMDGYEATLAIQRLLGEGAPPIVAMTANAMAADRAAALAAGMVDHVGKPFDLAQLIAVILRHARRDGAALVADGAPAAATADQHSAPGFGQMTQGGHGGMPPPAVAGLNSAAALKRMGGLQSVYIMALRSFVEEADKLAAELQTAHAALDTAAALPALHTLKGLAGTIGADRLADLARDAEHALRPGGAAGAWQLVALALAACPAAVDDVESLLVQLAAGATA